VSGSNGKTPPRDRGGVFRDSAGGGLLPSTRTTTSNVLSSSSAAALLFSISSDRCQGWYWRWARWCRGQASPIRVVGIGESSVRLASTTPPATGPDHFAVDLTELVTAARNRVGDAAVVVGSVAPSSAARRCLGCCEASSAGALLRCRRRPIGLRDGSRGSLSSFFQRR
jgi:hypothetical protein